MSLSNQAGGLQVGLRSPARMCLLGCSGVGKSTLVLDLIANCNEIFSSPISGGIFYLHSHHQSLYDEFKSAHPELSLTFSNEMNAASAFVDSDDSNHKILVVDDYIGNMNTKEFLHFINDLFLGRARHTNTNIIFISQCIFSPLLRIVRVNANHLILFPFKQDKRSIITLASQILPKKTDIFMEAYSDAIKDSFGYLHINFDVPSLEPQLSNSIYPRTGIKYYMEPMEAGI